MLRKYLFSTLLMCGLAFSWSALALAQAEGNFPVVKATLKNKVSLVQDGESFSATNKEKQKVSKSANAYLFLQINSSEFADRFEIIETTESHGVNGGKLSLDAFPAPSSILVRYQELKNGTKNVLSLSLQKKLPGATTAWQSPDPE